MLTCCADEVPLFRQTSSPELDTLLARFRNDVFIPQSLGYRHKQLIYRTKYSPSLEEHPITVSVQTGKNAEEENYKLRHLDITKSPRTTELRDVVKMMKTREDWYNLAPFLSGLRISRRNIADNLWEFVLRKAGEAGVEDIAYRLAKYSGYTGLSLSKPGVTRALFFNFHRKARLADFKGEELLNALSFAENTALLLNAKHHSAPVISQDPKRKPDIIGILLELRAAYAIDAFGGKDEGGHVRGYAMKVLDTWVLGDFDVPNGFGANWKLFELVPLWHGLKLALQVEEVKSDKNLNQALASKIGEIGKKIEAAVESVPKKSEDSVPTGVALSKLLYKK